MSTTKGYYITSSAKTALIYSSSGSRESIIGYFKRITSLKEVFNVYAKYGKSFWINKPGHQVAFIIKGFIKAIFTRQKDLNTTGQWASFARLIYINFTHYLRGPGIYEIYESGVQIIKYLLHYEEGSSIISSSQLFQNFLQIVHHLGGSNSNFNDNIEQLLRDAGINHSSPQLIGFLRFIEILSSLNTSAAYNAITNGNRNVQLSEFFLPNSRLSVHEFEQILHDTPELAQLLRVFIQMSGGGRNWISIFSSNDWEQLFNNVPGLQQFIGFERQNPGFGSFLKLGETFADGIKNFSKNVADLANSFPIPNPFAPVISGFAGGVGGVASQASNGLHLFDGILGGSGQQNNSSENNESKTIF